MDLHNTTNYEDSMGYKIGVASITYFGGLIAATVVGAVLGFGLAWLSIWLDALYIWLMSLLCAFAPALVGRKVIGRRNTATFIIGAISGFISICVLLFTLDWQEMVWEDQKSIWSMLPVYGTVAALGGAYMGVMKLKE